ncbi:MAG: DNA-directed RNA polymerase subunit alpha, partial [Planctomycetes bacterium]|nr:DNA-directed RNA polymerase subunit alpha [Planctomycetota bacterium]
LNVKRLLVKLEGQDGAILRLKLEKKGEVLARHLQCPGHATVVNPNLKLLTLAKDRPFDMEITVQSGRGYRTAEENAREDMEIGVIPVDSIFSPVQRVRYRTENTRVGKMTNYDRLIIEVWTDGTVTPESAMVEASKIFRKHLNPFVQYFEIGAELPETERKGEEEIAAEKSKEQAAMVLSAPISELDLSVRAANCMEIEGIQTIGDLLAYSEAKLLEVRNFGKTSLKEIQKKLSERGLSLAPDDAAGASEVKS